MADVTVTVLDSQLARAAELAKAMTDDPDMTEPWTVQDVINVALGRGLDALERTYVKNNGTCGKCGHSRTEHLTRSPSRPEPYFCAQCSCRQYRDGGQPVTGHG